MRARFRCNICGKTELYLFTKAADRLDAKKAFAEKHKNCEMPVANKNNVIPFRRK